LNMQNLQDALAKPTKYTINHGPYLMVELPDFLGSSVIRQQLNALLHARIRPIITHPERNVLLQSGASHLEQWVADGCLVQVTAQSFLGRFGPPSRRAAETLMNARLVHLVASDAHDCIHRPPDLSIAYQHVVARWGKTRAQALFTANPLAILSGEPVQRDVSIHRWLRFFDR
jgi:protein-tyrosine phosphatase